MINTQNLGKPILNQVAQNAITQNYVGNHLFPGVPVPVRSGLLLNVDGNELGLYDTQRTHGANVLKFKAAFSEKPFSLESHALADCIPIEFVDDGSLYPEESLIEATRIRVLKKLGLTVEFLQAQKALNPDEYSAENQIVLSGTAQWTHEESNPSLTIETGRNAIRAKTGRYPNVAMLADKVFAAIRKHPDFQGRDPITPAFLAALWNIEKVVIGDAAYKDAGGAVHDIWGKNVVLAYAPENDPPDFFEASFGYLFRLNNCPKIDDDGFEEVTRSFVFTGNDEFTIEITNPDLGYLMQAVVP